MASTLLLSSVARLGFRDYIVLGKYDRAVVNQ